MDTSDSATAPPFNRRTLIVRDFLILLSLTLLVVALFGITLFLFRSFTAHRAALARRWLDRGRFALAHGRPGEAADALRATLEYAPEDADSKFLLAQALEQSGHVNEATNYFSELWEQRPGSGPINLERARLAARQGEQQQAIDFYRAALYGTWEGDGVVRRRAIRLEFARYLLAQKNSEAAQAELLVAGGNNPGDADTDLAIARLLEQADDKADAYRLYLRAAASAPHRAAACFAAGQIDLGRNNFASARKLFLEADAAISQQNAPDPTLKQRVADRLRLLHEVLGLIPSSDLSNSERVDRILRARTIARSRLSMCERAQQPDPSSLATLNARWSASDAVTTRRMLLRDWDRQRATIELIQQTAELTARACAASPEQSSVDDEALLLVARAEQQGGH